MHFNKPKDFFYLGGLIIKPPWNSHITEIHQLSSSAQNICEGNNLDSEFF
jgi:hypothetical protein